MNVKQLTEQTLEFLSLTRGRTCSSESTLVKMPHCWKSHVAAFILLPVSVSVHDILVLIAYASSEGSGETALYAFKILSRYEGCPRKS